jgi:hypothetical protein
MTPGSFIGTWQANTRNEAVASKSHFLDLGTLLAVPPPQSDPTGTTYAFEKGVRQAAGGGGWADVWKRGCFGWEYKSRGGDLEKAHDQLLRYAGALENPPLLITSDMERIIERTASAGWGLGAGFIFGGTIRLTWGTSGGVGTKSASSARQAGDEQFLSTTGSRI